MYSLEIPLEMNTNYGTIWAKSSSRIFNYNNANETNKTVSNAYGKIV